MSDSSPARTGRSRTVLVVDDDALIRQLVRLSVADLGGHGVREAGSGAEGVAAAAADPPDAVLLDLHLPDLHGREVLARLRADPRTAGVPVVVLTGSPTDGDRAELVKAGAAGVVAKPFDPAGLAGELDRLLGW